MSELAARIQAVIRQCRVPDRAGEAVVEMLSQEYVIVPKPEARSSEYRDPKTMTPWELAQAIAINSDIAGSLYAKRGENDDSDPNYRAAGGYYQRRNDCIAEIRDREHPDLARDAPAGE